MASPALARGAIGSGVNSTRSCLANSVFICDLNASSMCASPTIITAGRLQGFLTLRWRLVASAEARLTFRLFEVIVQVPVEGHVIRGRWCVITRHLVIRYRLEEEVPFISMPVMRRRRHIVLRWLGVGYRLQEGCPVVGIQGGWVHPVLAIYNLLLICLSMRIDCASAYSGLVLLLSPVNVPFTSAHTGVPWSAVWVQSCVEPLLIDSPGTSFPKGLVAVPVRLRAAFSQPPSCTTTFHGETTGSGVVSPSSRSVRRFPSRSYFSCSVVN
ncbi:hypothetical protein C8F04DRAFT_1267011 [Mycena alexandri]|uniref:Uncharacterized protein n=1 Tax=Mycena alexandri TaxID=1745969 RepID=A0AAD6X064_9AGAR|nr:hypothetical protein C8F04DRAFT_1267011 [Mycena alexandri]